MARALAFRSMLFAILGIWLLTFWQLAMVVGTGEIHTGIKVSAAVGVIAAVLAIPIPLAALFLFFVSVVAFHVDSAGRLSIRQTSWFARLLRWNYPQQWQYPQTGCSVFWLTVGLFYMIALALFMVAIVSAIGLGLWLLVPKIPELLRDSDSAFIVLLVLGTVSAIISIAWFVRRPAFRVFWRAFIDKTCPIVHIEN